MGWFETVFLLTAVTGVGTSTSDFCSNPSLGPGGSPKTYCEAQTTKVVSTPYFRMTVPEGAWFAIDEDGRSGRMQPKLSVSMRVLSVRVLDQKALYERLAGDNGQCSYVRASAERICINETDVTLAMERIVIGVKHSLLVQLVELRSEESVETYSHSLMAVTLPDD